MNVKSPNENLVDATSGYLHKRTGGTSAIDSLINSILEGIERFENVPQNIKDGIANSDSAGLQLLLVNGFKFQEVEEARKYIQ